MFDIIYLLEMIGIVAFAVSGMIVARSKNMDPVGVFTIGFITALGGGTLRDLMMDNHPLYWIKHQEQPILILAIAIVFSYWRRAERIRESGIVFPDAIGLGIFSISFAGCWLYFVCQWLLASETIALTVGLLFIVIVRMLAVRFDIRLQRDPHQQR